MAYIKVQASHRIASLMQKESPKYKIKLIKMSEGQYKKHVHYDGYYFAEAYNDIDSNGNFKAIEVIYPYDYYAMPRYITTKDIIEAFKNIDSYKNIEPIDAFKKELKVLIEV